ncbi:hypothetical protein BDN67DRAFT_933260 [Paxillus ammoniavirescens]|nr:hypothetical protein BDN67DRAFT_933260 [Paxillus ammoniavirescens]
MSTEIDTVETLRLAFQGFDRLFANDMDGAIDVFGAEGQEESPFHLIGLGVCAFLKAALGMEIDLMEDASDCLALAEQVAKKQIKVAKASKSPHRFPAGMEWEVIHTDAVVLLGLTHALSESYTGYLQFLYQLNSAHSKFTKMFKTLYPNGLDDYPTPGHTPIPSPTRSVRSSAAQSMTGSAPPQSQGFFARWGFTSSTPAAPLLGTVANPPDGPLEELILSGAAFGYGLFNLVLSLLPSKVRSVVGILGYNQDRQLALQALAVSAARSDVHSVFSGLVLMTYYGVILLVSGYQADEEHILKQYKSIMNRVSDRYPKGTLWALNKAKIQRITKDPEGAIETLKEGLAPGREDWFPQADALLAFELAWTLLGFRRYEECATTFLELTNMNSWSHATYRYIAAGCYVSAGKLDEAQKLFNKIPDALNKRRRSVSTESFIKKKLDFYKKKQLRRGGDPKRYVEAMKISPAEEFAIFWNTHAHIDKETALVHIKALSELTPPLGIEGEYMPAQPAPPTGAMLDLDTPDELAVRSLILGIIHRTIGDYVTSRALLHDALKHFPNVEVSSWVGGITYFELTVLEMKDGEKKAIEGEAKYDEAETEEEEEKAQVALFDLWEHVFKVVKEALSQAHALCTKDVDLSARLESRVVMLRDEIKTRMETLGLD